VIIFLVVVIVVIVLIATVVAVVIAGNSVAVCSLERRSAVGVVVKVGPVRLPGK
jgi:hypothetical protein